MHAGATPAIADLAVRDQLVLMAILVLCLFGFRRGTARTLRICLAIVAIRIAALQAANMWTAHYAAAAIDAAVFALLVRTALCSGRHYPLVLAAAGLIALVSHGLALIGSPGSAAALPYLLTMSSAVMALALLIGLLRGADRVGVAADDLGSVRLAPGG